jgi:hypothetical protein
VRCDFCGAEITSKDDITVFPTSEFRIDQYGYWNMSWGWGGCPECAVYLRNDDWDGLLERAVAAHESGEVARTVLGAIYQGVRDNQTGPLRGWDPAKDEASV